MRPRGVQLPTLTSNLSGLSWSWARLLLFFWSPQSASHCSRNDVSQRSETNTTKHATSYNLSCYVNSVRPTSAIQPPHNPVDFHRSSWFRILRRDKKAATPNIDVLEVYVKPFCLTSRVLSLAQVWHNFNLTQTHHVVRYRTLLCTVEDLRLNSEAMGYSPKWLSREMCRLRGI